MKNSKRRAKSKRMQQRLLMSYKGFGKCDGLTPILFNTALKKKTILYTHTCARDGNEYKEERRRLRHNWYIGDDNIKIVQDFNYVGSKVKNNNV